MSSNAAQEHFAVAFEANARRFESDPAWLRGLRDQAMGCFRDLGFPTRRTEGWRHTNFAPIARQRFELAAADTAAPSAARLEELCFPVFACSLFVFLDGAFVPGLSTPKPRASGLPVESLAELRKTSAKLRLGPLGQLADSKRNPFTALNAAFLDDGAVIRIPEGRVEPEPIHLVFLSSGAAAAQVSHPRVSIHAGANSRATIIQDFVSLGTALRFTNAVTEVELAAEATLDLVTFQRECEQALCVSSLTVRQQRDSHFSSHTLTLGGGLVRNDLCVELSESGADCTLAGLFQGIGQQRIDNHTTVDHAVPSCSSNELYKGILDENARAVFTGRVIVRPGAQGTRAAQKNPNLLLSDSARVTSQPELEIYADDVTCSHGSSTGQLDPEALFYLRSRGIGVRAARDLLTRGFAAQITRALPIPALGDRVQELLVGRLRGGAAPGDSP